VREIDLEIEQIKQRTKLIENEILRVRSESEQIKKEAEQIKKETEQLRRENARLNLLNAKTRHLISCVDQLCFPPKCSSTLPKPTDPDCRPSSP
jgi:archaellum component FlaC